MLRGAHQARPVLAMPYRAHRIIHRIRWLLAVLGALLPAAGLTLTAAPAGASGPAPRVVAFFSFAAGQTPEQIAFTPGGGFDISFAEASQVAYVSPGGQTTILARLPQTGDCPVFDLPITVGLARVPGGINVVNCDGNNSTGIWRAARGQAPRQIARLPADSCPNDVAEAGGWLYVPDSALGVVWRIPAAGGPAQVWASGPALTPTSLTAGPGANGVFAEGGAIWVDNTDRGTLLRIPVEPGGQAGPIITVASGLSSQGLDNFIVLPDGVALVPEYVADQVVEIRHGQVTTLLTASDGLNNPVDVKVEDGTMFIANSAYISAEDPDLEAVSLPAGL